MTSYILRRVVIGVPTLLAIVTLTFVMIRLAPGDPAQAYVEEGGGAQALEAARKMLGLDQPFHVQYIRYLGLLVKGDLGNSLVGRRPVVELISTRVPYTLQLGLAGLGIAVVLAVPLGVLAGVNRNRLIDRLVTVGAVVTYSVPKFWLAMLLLLGLGLHAGWFPVLGAGDQGNVVSTLWHLVLPALAMGISEAAFIARMTRSCVIDEISQDYVRTAQSKGLGPGKLILRHVLRNALIPIVTVIGFSLVGVVSGSVVIETIFVRPGVGLLLIDGINQRDYTVVQGAILTFAIAILIVNLCIDVLYGALDPRVRYD